MISTTYRNIIYGLALISIVIILTMPDVLIGLLLELIHFIFEIMFICFEWLETLLDNVVEHLLHTELHETQTIVFYVLMVIFAIPLYYLWRMLLRLFFRLKETLPSVWALNKTRASIYWQELSLNEKIKLIAISVGAIYLASFLVL